MRRMKFKKVSRRKQIDDLSRLGALLALDIVEFREREDANLKSIKCLQDKIIALLRDGCQEAAKMREAERREIVLANRNAELIQELDARKCEIAQ